MPPAHERGRTHGGGIGGSFLTWTAVAIVAVSFVVVPLLVLGLGSWGWSSALGVSNTTLALLSMLPGVLMGLGALLTMSGGSS